MKRQWKAGTVRRMLLYLWFCIGPLAVPLAAQFFTQYEYEEDMYLSLDGSARLYVNASIPALASLRGVRLDTDGRVDTAGVEAWYSSPDTRVTRVTTSRRSGRLFVHVRIDVGDVNQLGEVRPFAWSEYRFSRDDDRYVYRQHVGASAGGPHDLGWSGREIVAFRLHVPSRITYHNAGADNLRRGNILVWEQPLADRLASEPVSLDVQMEGESILYRTLFLFVATGVAVVVMFAGILWKLTRKPT